MTDNQFIKTKDQILTEYQRQITKLGGSIAAQGFSYEPGFMYTAQNELETDIKFKISELNFTLLQEAVERELKQSGLDYDLAYKNAVIAWESDKQVLMDALNQELANLKREMGYDSEQVKLLALEVKKRQALLIDAKTVIEIEAEAIRKQIADLDGTTGVYEVSLADAKVLTAQKKLEVIPYIEQIISIEEDILNKELQLIDKESSLLDKEESIYAKDQELIGKNQELLGKQNELLSAGKSLYNASKNVYNSNVDKLSAQQDLLAAETEAIELRTSLVEPALETQIETMGRYVTELAIQLALYEEISAIKTATVTIKEQQADVIGIVLEKRREIAEATSEIATLFSGLVDYKIIELAPTIADLVSVYERYADEIGIQTGLRSEIANIKKLTAELIPLQVDGELAVSNAKTNLEAANATNAAAKLAIRIQDSLGQLAKITQQTANSIEYSGLFGTAKDAEYDAKENSFNSIIDIIESREIFTHDNNIENKLSIEEARRESMRDDADAYEDMVNEKAELRTAAEGITAQLTHLLSQD